MCNDQKTWHKHSKYYKNKLPVMLMVLQQFTFGTRKIQASAVNSDPSDLKLKAWAKVPVVRTGENTVLFRTSYTHHSMLLCDM